MVGEKDKEGHTALYYATSKSVIDRLELAGLTTIGDFAEQEERHEPNYDHWEFKLDGEPANAIPPPMRIQEPRTFGVPKRRIPIFGRNGQGSASPATHHQTPASQRRDSPPKRNANINYSDDDWQEREEEAKNRERTSDPPPKAQAIPAVPKPASSGEEVPKKRPMAKFGIPAKKPHQQRKNDDIDEIFTRNQIRY
jgi:hypothetical protein